MREDWRFQLEAPCGLARCDINLPRGATVQPGRSGYAAVAKGAGRILQLRQPPYLLYFSICQVATSKHAFES